MELLQGLGQGAITIALFVLILFILVLVHEVGHFIVARRAHVRVHEFGIGFPPRARTLGSDGETTYTLNWLPIGGFVRLEGEDGDSDDPRSFTRARLPVKVLILLAGVAMNLLLAFTIFFGLSWLANPTAALRIGEVQAGSPAAAGGLEAGDSLVSIAGQPFDYFAGPAAVIGELRASAGQTVTIGVAHADGTVETVEVTLRPPAQISEKQGALGIASLSWESAGGYITRDPVSAFRIAVGRTVDSFGLILDGLGQLVGSVARNPTQAPPVAGPIGIAVQVGDVFWQLGPVFTLYLVALLSANLALVNALPFPPLDGGRLVVVVVQSLVGNRISQTAERVTYFVGFVFLMGFLLWVSSFDIARLVNGGTP